MKSKTLQALQNHLFPGKMSLPRIAFEAVVITLLFGFLFQYMPMKNPNGAIPQLHFSLFLFVVLSGKTIALLFKVFSLLLFPRKRTVLSLLPCSYEERVAVCREQFRQFIKESALLGVLSICFGTLLEYLFLNPEPLTFIVSFAMVLSVLTVQFLGYLSIPLARRYVSKIDHLKKGKTVLSSAAHGGEQQFKQQLSEKITKRINDSHIALVVRHQLHSLIIESKLSLFILFIAVPAVALFFRFAFAEQFQRWNISILMGAFTLLLVSMRTVLLESKSKLLTFPYYRVDRKAFSQGNTIVSLLLFLPVLLTMLLTLSFEQFHISLLEIVISIAAMVIVVFLHTMNMRLKAGFEAVLSMLVILQIILFNFLDAFTAGLGVGA